MKKKIFVILYVLLILLCGRQLLNYFYNKHIVEEYLAGNYTVNENLLLSLNIIEPYIAYYNNGNILYKNHLYEEAIQAYEDALACPGIPERRECSIRINLALAKIALLPDDYDAKANIDESLEILYDARNVLIEGGCANEDGTGHSNRAERLKREIDRIIEYLENKQTGTLEIRKTITGVDDVHNLSQISFTVVGPEEFVPVTVIFDADSDLWVQEGETYTLTLDDLPLGEYTVTEDQNGATDEWACSTDNGYQVRVDVIAGDPCPAEITNEYSQNQQQPQNPSDNSDQSNDTNQSNNSDQSNDTNQSNNSDQTGSSDQSNNTDQSNNSDQTGQSNQSDNTDQSNSSDQTGNSDQTGGSTNDSNNPSQSNTTTQGSQSTQQTNNTAGTDQSGTAPTARPTTFEEWEQQVRESIESLQSDSYDRRQDELEEADSYSNWNSDYNGIW